MSPCARRVPRQTNAARARAARASRPEFRACAPQGGCGAMYKCYIESPRFAGLNTIKQHKLVQGVLKDEIADMHGFQLKTALPK